MNENLPSLETDLDVEQPDVFAVLQLTRDTALGSLVGVDLVRVEALEFVSVQSPPILDLATGVLDLEPLA